MVLEAVSCKHCGDIQSIKKFGISRTGKQRYRCYSCRRTFITTYTNKAHDPAIQEKIIQMALNGSGVRDTARVLGISPNTVTAHFKKK